MNGYLGDFPTGATVYVPFHTFNSSGASVTLTGLAVTDIEIYKDGGTTQRSSDAGYTLLDTDGIDFDSITGIHGFKIDLSDNTDAGFYAAAHDYFVVVSAVTVDSQTVNFVACSFSIENRSITANVTKWLGTAAATPTTAGVPEIDVTHWNGTAVASPATAGYPAVTLKVGTGTGEVNLASGKAPATIAAGDIANSAITAASIAADAITDAKVASDVTIASVTGAVGSVTGAVGSVTGAVGSVTGNVGGNVTGSVGSVVGAVGSVTGAVGSVTGNVGGNVVGSVASVTAGVNATQINSSANAAARLALAAAQMIPGTVDSTAFSPTTTVFEADDITEATADHYNGRLILWTSGALVGQVTDVTDYALSGGRGRFTVTAMTEAPANNDTFILV